MYKKDEPTRSFIFGPEKIYVFLFYFFLLCFLNSRVQRRRAFFGEKVAENAKIRGSQTRSKGILSQKETLLRILNK